MAGDLRVLRHVCKPRQTAEGHRAGVRCLEPGEDAEERRLPAPVRTDEPDAVAVVDPERESLEERRRAVGFRNLLTAEEERQVSLSAHFRGAFRATREAPTAGGQADRDALQVRPPADAQVGTWWYHDDIPPSAEHSPLIPHADISRRTLAYYETTAAGFWEQTRDHDVTENVVALLDAIEGSPPWTILDFGCGPGRDLRTFRDRGHVAVGLDGARAFVAMAGPSTGCEVLHQDFLALDLPAARFDGVFANASLFHVPSRELPRVLRELWCALRPRGCSSRRTHAARTARDGRATVTACGMISPAGGHTARRRASWRSVISIGRRDVRGASSRGWPRCGANRSREVHFGQRISASMPP